LPLVIALVGCIDVIKSKLASKQSSYEKRFTKYKDRLIATLAAPSNEPTSWKSDLAHGLVDQDYLKFILLNFTVLEPNSRMQVIQIAEELMNKEVGSKIMNPLSEYIFYNKGELIPHLIHQYSGNQFTGKRKLRAGSKIAKELRL
jgi:hypothetical protein